MSLFKRAVENWATNDISIEKSVRIVMDWSQNLPDILPCHEGNTSMLSMEKASKWLIDKLFTDPRTKTVYVFSKNGISHIWVALEKTNAKTEYEYSWQKYLFTLTGI